MWRIPTTFCFDAIRQDDSTFFMHYMMPLGPSMGSIPCAGAPHWSLPSTSETLLFLVSCSRTYPLLTGWPCMPARPVYRMADELTPSLMCGSRPIWPNGACSRFRIGEGYSSLHSNRFHHYLFASMWLIRCIPIQKHIVHEFARMGFVNRWQEYRRRSFEHKQLKCARPDSGWQTDQERHYAFTCLYRWFSFFLAVECSLLLFLSVLCTLMDKAHVSIVASILFLEESFNVQNTTHGLTFMTMRRGRVRAQLWLTSIALQTI